MSTIKAYGLLHISTTETGCGMTINQERFTTYISLSPVLTTQTTSKLVVIVGTRKAMAIAVKNNKTEKRYTLLKQRLRLPGR